MTRRRAAVARRPWRVWCFPALAVLVVGVSVVWGWHVQSDPNVKLGAAPLVGRWHLRFGPSLVPATVLATLAVWRGPALAQRLRYHTLACSAALASVGFTFLLAASDGLRHVLDPVVHPSEYWANLATLPDGSTMLHRYGSVEFLVPYSVHAKGHPPGFLLLLKALAAIGLGHPWVTATLSYLGVALVAAAGLYTLRAIVGDESARRTAPFLVVVPYAVWMGTSADAFYAGVGAVGALLVVTALRHDRRAPRAALAFAAGLTLGSLLFLTYGATIFGLLVIMLAVGMTRGRRRALVESTIAAAVGAFAVLVAFRLAGFWWFDGLRVTRAFYWGGTAHFRPAAYFAVANLGAALIAIGPAVVAGMNRLRDRRAWLVVGAAALCIAAADASQYSKAEVERIWLLFYPWLVAAVVSLPHPRRWLGAQAALAVGLQVALVSKW
jgi:methylthioxylose transferase